MNWLKINVKDRFHFIKSIRGRIIFAELCVVVPAIILLGVVINRLIAVSLINAETESYKKVLESSDITMNQYLDNYRDIARNILSDTVLQTELNRSNQDEEETSLINELSFVRLERSMQKFIYGFRELQSIYIYDNAGKLFYIDYKESSSNVAKEYDYDAISNETWCQEILDTEGYEKFYGRNVISNSETEISCVKRILDLNSLQPLGIMVVNFRKDSLDNIFPSIGNEGGTFGIIEKDRELPHIVTAVSGNEEENSHILDIAEGKDRDCFYITYRDSKTEWELLYTIARQNLVKEAGNIRRIINFGSLVAILVLLLLTVLVCNRSTKPLYQLKDNIIRVGDGERSLQDTFSDDEIGLIGREFNKMVNEKLALSEKVTRIEIKNKEAELELLQSNINPHFLYNTLDSLYWMAVVEETEDIAELTQALSSIFRTALSGGEKQITIGEELDFIKNYLFIQNIRFQGKIQAEWNVDERLLNRKIIKLLLQPFVENAVYHGLEPKRDGGTIVFNIYQEDGLASFEISDNGVGMDVEKAKVSGYALKNSMERINLVYGERASIDFDSEIGKGVKVTIRIPLEELEC